MDIDINSKISLSSWTTFDHNWQNTIKIHTLLIIWYQLDSFMNSLAFRCVIWRSQIDGRCYWLRLSPDQQWRFSSHYLLKNSISNNAGFICFSKRHFIFLLCLVFIVAYEALSLLICCFDLIFLAKLIVFHDKYLSTHSRNC